MENKIKIYYQNNKRSDTYEGLPVLRQCWAPRWKVSHLRSITLHSRSGEKRPLSSIACCSVQGHLNTVVANLSEYDSLWNQSWQKCSFHLPLAPYSRSHWGLKYHDNGIARDHITGECFMSFPKIVGSVKLMAMKPKVMSDVSLFVRSLNSEGSMSVLTWPSLSDPGSANVSIYVRCG